METTTQEIAAQYQRWMEAIRQKDVTTLEGIIGQEYVYTASGQGRFSRQQWFDTVPVYDIQAFSFPQMDVLDYGDVAIAVVRYVQEARVRGVPRSGEFLITDAWVKRAGRWQVVARSSLFMTPA